MAAAGAAVALLTAALAGPDPPDHKQKFEQLSCIDDSCSVGCIPEEFPMGTCVLLEGGGSAIAQSCTSVGGLNLRMYPLSCICDGPSADSHQPVGKCVEDIDDLYFINLCEGAPPNTTAAVGARRRPPSQRAQSGASRDSADQQRRRPFRVPRGARGNVTVWSPCAGVQGAAQLPPQ